MFQVSGLYGQQAPVLWRSQPWSILQSVARPFRFLDRGYGTSCPKTLQWRHHCQSFGIDWRHNSFRNHVLMFWHDISVNIFSGPCSGISYFLGHLKIIELSWTASDGQTDGQTDTDGAIAYTAIAQGHTENCRDWKQQAWWLEKTDTWLGRAEHKDDHDRIKRCTTMR